MPGCLEQSGPGLPLSEAHRVPSQAGWGSPGRGQPGRGQPGQVLITTDETKQSNTAYRGHGGFLSFLLF